MPVAMKRLHIEKIETVLIGNKVFHIPREKVRAILVLLEDADVAPQDDEVVSSDEVFRELDKKYTRPGVALRGARGKENMTQVELARKLGITQSDLSKMEHGKRPIGKKMAKRLSKILNIDYRIFL